MINPRYGKRVLRHPVKVYKGWRMIGMRRRCSIRFMLDALLMSGIRFIFDAPIRKR